MGFGDAADEREPEAERAVRRARAVVAAVEGLEDLLELGIREAGASIFDHEDHLVLGRVDAQRRHAAAVALGVLEEVRERAAEQRRVALEADRLLVALEQGEVQAGALERTRRDVERLELAVRERVEGQP